MVIAGGMSGKIRIDCAGGSYDSAKKYTIGMRARPNNQGCQSRENADRLRKISSEGSSAALARRSMCSRLRVLRSSSDDVRIIIQNDNITIS